MALQELVNKENHSITKIPHSIELSLILWLKVVILLKVMVEEVNQSMEESSRMKTLI